MLAQFLAHWQFYWLPIVRAPKAFFANPNAALSVPARSFFFFTQSAAFVVPPIVVMLPVLRGSIEAGVLLPVLIIAVAFPVAMGAHLVVATAFGGLVAVASYAAYRTAGSTSGFRGHFRQFVFLGATEPLIALAMAMYLRRPGVTPEVLLPFVVFVASRLWVIRAGFFALQSIHALPSRRSWAAFLPGFALPVCAVTVLHISLWVSVGALLAQQ